jgi:hypothetical protein
MTMPPESKELLAALRDLRHTATTEAAERIERWRSDIEQPSYTPPVPPISRSTWRSGATTCAISNAS